MASKPLTQPERYLAIAGAATVFVTLIAVAFNPNAPFVTVNAIIAYFSHLFEGYIILGALIALCLGAIGVRTGAVVAGMFLPLLKLISVMAPLLLCGFAALMLYFATSGLNMWLWLSTFLAVCAFVVLLANLAIFYKRT